MARLTLVRKPPRDELPLRAPELRERLCDEAAKVMTMVETWASREESVSFKDFELALRDLVFAFARIAIMLFLALREEHVMRQYPGDVERGGRRFRRAPPSCAVSRRCSASSATRGPTCARSAVAIGPGSIPSMSNSAFPAIASVGMC